MQAPTINLAGPTTRAIAEFRGALARSLFPSTPAELRLVDEQLAMARKGTWANLFVTPLAATLLALSEAGLLPFWRLALWPIALTLAYSISNFYYDALLKRADHSAADIQWRSRTYARATFMLAAIWCGMCYDLLVPGNIASEAVMFTALACSLSAWSSIGAYHLASAIAAMPFYLAAMVAMPLVEGRSGVLFAGLAIAYWLLMRTHMMMNYSTRERMLLLEQERSGLIENLRAAKEESDAARHRAEEASRAKSAFLANMSHELRTPLNAILGFSEIIGTKAMGPAAVDLYAEYGNYIHSSGDHLLSLINDILDLSKIEAGRLTLRESELDLRRLMDDTAQMMTARAVASGVSLAVHIERSFPNIYADERAVRQILANLASNAVKFTPPGGRVTAFASLLADGSPAFGIDDTGLGIAPDDQDKVFESFGQGRHDAVLADKGTGLGLPIVRGLAEAHGGTVKLESMPSRGTRITVILPPDRTRARLKAAS
ncbi:MAG TPA: ATP-binding protein [Rhizomicrobium sp.]|nr:ATP-binding protein [Rhizomicrobium sp.]